MNQKKRLLSLAAGAIVAAGTVASVVLVNEHNEVPAAQATESQGGQVADVAAADPQTGAKVYVDSESQVVKELGEPGKLTVQGQKRPSFQITVNNVQVLKSCTLRGFGEEIKPVNGNFLLLDVSATLDASAAKAVDAEVVLMPLDASVFGVSAGENKNVSYELDSIASYSCDVPDALDIAVGAGDTVQGQVMLDSPYDSGQVVYDPEKTGGWTWSY